MIDNILLELAEKRYPIPPFEQYGGELMHYSTYVHDQMIRRAAFIAGHKASTDEQNDEHRAMRIIAEELWSLLDDIDTATDIFKPDNNNNFVQCCYKKVAERFKLLTSDGHKIYTTEEFIKLQQNKNTDTKA